ncbi:TIGR01777 family oxidoreductase, partial [candidate division KSB1 bacterium]|nr:TIGR01777 family oxidoreductase [candidate division KSB1 bacterium]
LEGVDAVVHLAGEPIFGIWTAEKRKAILSSRVEGTRFLSQRLAELRKPPSVLITASAIGFYGDRGEEKLDEKSPSGDGFLADVCRQWEAAAQPAADAGIRCAQTRFGLVLTPYGGLLQKLVPVFRVGLGGRLGSGRAFMSWIALGDLLRALAHVLNVDDLAGAVNLVSPNPVSNRDFTRSLASAFHRPALLPVPSPLIRLALGQMGEEMLLSSTRVYPSRLLASDFEFQGSKLQQVFTSFFQTDTEAMPGRMRDA